MWYIGGKIRLSKYIVPFLQESSKQTGNFIDLFCGGCNIIDKVSSSLRVANDSNIYLMEMWKSLQNGWIPNLKYTKDFYVYVRDNKDSLPKDLVGLVGFHYSYGGKFFGGYARSRYKDHIERSISHTIQQSQRMKDVKFENKDYKEFSSLVGWTIYCDIPYKNSTQSTTKYGVEFDYNCFWEWARMMSNNNNVFVSEKTAPRNIFPIWTYKHSSNMSYKKETKTVEKLFKL